MADSNTNSFHMVQLWLDPQRMVQLGRMLGLDLAQTDTNYLVHAALGELFGDAAPTPYFVDDDPRTIDDTAREKQHVRVLGYAGLDAEALREEAKLCPNPTVTAICDWDRFVSKEMPTSFREGRRLGFEIRACPVVRKASAGQTSDGTEWREGQELDAFLSRVWEIDDPDVEVNREDVYREWLKRQFEIRGGATPNSIGMTRFSIERMTRRTQGDDRDQVIIKRPDVTLRGTLEVTDSNSFTSLVRSGIGRHRTFGYGMLKIRRA